MSERHKYELNKTGNTDLEKKIIINYLEKEVCNNRYKEKEVHDHSEEREEACRKCQMTEMIVNNLGTQREVFFNSELRLLDV